MAKDNQDVRWIQRFSNYKKALKRLEELVSLASKTQLDGMQRDALIHRFERTQELSWKVIKDFFEYMGDAGIQGPKQAVRLAFQRGLIEDGQAFMDSIVSRQNAEHAYKEEIAKKVQLNVVNKYFAAFVQLREALQKELEKETH